MINKKIVIVAAIVSIIILFISVFNTYISKANKININWKIDIPTEDKRIYEAYSDPSFFGDGFTYSVVEYKNSKKHNKMLTALEWKTMLLEQEKNDINIILNHLEIDSEYMFELDDECIFYSLYKDNGASQLFIIYSVNKQYMYIMECKI